MSPNSASLAAFALAGALAATAASAADLPSRKGAPAAPAPTISACSETDSIPTDAFGFTTGSEVASVGSFGPSLTYAGGYGTRIGRLNSHGLQLQGSYGLFPCAEIGPYLLGGVTNGRALGVSTDATSYGAGVEMKYRLLGRDMHGIGLTLVIDPSVNRTNPDGIATNFTTYNTGIRLYADNALVPGKLYAAFNASQDMTWTGPSPYGRSSTLTLAGSLAWQVQEGLYLSGEVRHQRRHNDLGFGNEAGNATFVGPGVFWQASKEWALSAAYNIQVYGKAKGQPGDLDLTNFSRHVLKVKAGYSF